MNNTLEYFEKAYRPELARVGTHFLCLACLVHKPKDDRSEDSRYCQSCFDFLIDEVKASDTRDVLRKSRWMPKKDADKRRAKTIRQGIPLTQVFAQPNSDNKKPNAISGGRPAKDLPVEKINTMSDSGMKVPEILRQLKADGVEISKRTIYSILAGQRAVK